MELTAIKPYCLNKSKTEETFPFGDWPICYKVCGKIFAQLYEYKIPLECTAFRVQVFRQAYPGTSFVLPLSPGAVALLEYHLSGAIPSRGTSPHDRSCFETIMPKFFLNTKQMCKITDAPAFLSGSVVFTWDNRYYCYCHRQDHRFHGDGPQM